MIQEPNVAETFKKRAKERNKSLSPGDLDYKNAYRDNKYYPYILFKILAEPQIFLQEELLLCCLLLRQPPLYHQP